MRLLKGGLAAMVGMVPSTRAAAFRTPTAADWGPNSQQPQLRALNDHVPLTDGGALLSGESDTPLIITATYGTQSFSPEIKIMDTQNRIRWTWGGREMQDPNLVASADLRWCLAHSVNAVEVKMAADGSRVIVLFNESALVISHTPDTPETDKKVIWGACRPDLLPGAHTLEMLPDGFIAIATTGQTMDDGFVVYDTTTTTTADPDGSYKGPIQSVGGIPAVHALVWDETESLLWAAGNDAAADGRMGESHGLLNAYVWNKAGRGGGEKDGPPPVDPSPIHSYTFPTAALCDVEWGHGTIDGQYWDGPHDIAPLPNQRKFLITTDLDIHSFDLKSHEFQCCEDVAAQYLRGFTPVDARIGRNYETGLEVAIPRSDMKSVGVAGDLMRTTVYTQARWRTYLDDNIHILVDGVKMPALDPGPGGVYRARWFAQIPGWTKAG